MILKIFSVRDNKADAFLTPFFMSNRAVAVRAMSVSANTLDHQFSKHAEDFMLYELGEFEDVSGSIVTYGTPEFIAAAASLKRSPYPMVEDIGDRVGRDNEGKQA